MANSISLVHNPAAGSFPLPEHTAESRPASIASGNSVATSAAVSAYESLHFAKDSVYGSANEAAIHHKLDNLFGHCINGDNYAEMRTLIESRTRELHKMGETPASIEAVLAKGQQLDRLGQVARGTVRAIPFAVASVSYDKIPLLSSFAHSAAEVGLHAGLQAGIVDSIGSSLLDRATATRPWLSAKDDELHPLIRDAVKELKPSLLTTMVETGVASQAYSVRNLVRLATAATVTHFAGAKAAGETDTWLSAAGGLASGGAMNAILHAVDENKGRTGPEYLLGREDWQQQFTALKNTHVVSDTLKNAAHRVARLPLDIATDSLRAANSVLSAPSIGKTAVLAGGFAGVISLRSAISGALASQGFNAAAISAISHAANVVSSTPVFFAAPAAEVVGSAVADKMTQTLQESVPAAINSAAGWLGHQFYAALNRQPSSALNAAEQQV
ncbi:hypothetical protein ED28_08030 [[Pantoea] beijingensis]|uniref:Uncharacterized protein n=1 Tax=[Pantoea] beijingensis TaxID=1324864 RepID=A0A443IDU5_9GAMM|nr:MULTISPECIES: hypothetical protein [Erwiniaceae]RWR02319.1 hypothetical protein ED28_08030 [[Pantoea] beijingensis]